MTSDHTHPTRTHAEPVDVVVPSTVTETDAHAVEQTHAAWSMGPLSSRINSVLAVFLIALEALLAVRFALAAFGASSTSGFVEFVRDVSWPFVRPFADAFANRTWDEGVIEPGTLLAMGVWALVFLVIALLVNALVPDTETGGERVTRRRVTRY